MHSLSPLCPLGVNMDLPNAVLRTALLWVIMQQLLVISYWCFRKTYRSHLEGTKIQWFWILDSWTLRVGPIDCPEMSVKNYHFFFLRRYNFREVWAFSTSFFNLVRFLMQSFQFVIFILVISFFISSPHLLLGLPSDLVSAGDHSYTFFTMLLSGMRCTCLNQANLFALM